IWISQVLHFQGYDLQENRSLLLIGIRSPTLTSSRMVARPLTRFLVLPRSGGSMRSRFPLQVPLMPLQHQRYITISITRFDGRNLLTLPISSELFGMTFMLNLTSGRMMLINPG